MADNKKQKEVVRPDVDKVLASIDPDKRNVIVSAMVEMRQTFSGPLPRPADFKAYKEVLSNAPERILLMAEKQQQHRIDSEERIIKADIRESIFGQVFAVLLVVLFLAAAVYLGINGHDWLAGIVATLSATISAIFYLKSTPSNKDLDNVDKK
ncbi:DUF2335 domain-containing protein [Leyella stercorea]|jgi:uncharacterized membrane protein|uniref:DUF2335 domain-containing protein n=1 Tax=Leyella stercorea TaxID=363265 RepID=UPI002431724B|nr:DUF2335 domain-containing protein [Leyella stercorea]